MTILALHLLGMEQTHILFLLEQLKAAAVKAELLVAQVAQVVHTLATAVVMAAKAVIGQTIQANRTPEAVAEVLVDTQVMAVTAQTQAIVLVLEAIAALAVEVAEALLATTHAPVLVTLALAAVAV